MTGNQTSHITVTYSGDDGDKITRIYAVNEDISHKLDHKRDWLGRHIKNRREKKLQEWLENNGCRLDSPNNDTPAEVTLTPNGSTIQRYCRDGKLDRKNSPAFIWRAADGQTMEESWHDGKFIEPSTPAVVSDMTAQRSPPKASERPITPGLA